MAEPFEHLRMIEALLFAAQAPVTEATLRDRLPDGVNLRACLAELTATYAGRGVELVRRGDGWALRTAADLAWLLTRERERPRRLSRAAVETLAIVAYHQPVTRAEIENIRGVAIGKGTLDILVEADWIKPGRRREVPGRPLTWVTTDAFLDHFGLERLKDLPKLDELKSAGLLDARPAIDALEGEADALPLLADRDDQDN